MPIVTHDTGPAAPVRPPSVDPASRVRRLLGSARERAGSPVDAEGFDLLDAALVRFDAPVDIRIRGGLGSGRRTLAAALRARRGWRPAVDDLDEMALSAIATPAPPDAEIVCLRTAPCRHEEAWFRRARGHALLVVATGVDTAAPPHWAHGLPALDARRPSHGSVDTVVSFLDRAVDALAAVRTARLEAELDRLAVHPEVGELAEAALCALGGSGQP